MARRRQPRPLTPAEVSRKKKEIFPKAVFDSFNELIAKSFSDGEAYVGQDEVVRLMVRKGLNRQRIFSEGWLNIEGVYEDAGWKVDYDKPGFNEDYEASFTFTKKG